MEHFIEHLTDHLFLKYFLISGAIMAIIAHHQYNKISEQISLIKGVGLGGFMIINFLLGFINVLTLPLIFLRNYFLNRKILRYMKMIEDNENRIEELKNKEKNNINEIAENKKIIQKSSRFAMNLARFWAFQT
jgi:hypothetical protein